MTWLPKCDCCGDPLAEPGALYFGPADKDGKAPKKHICVKCQPLFEALFARL